MKKNKIMLQAIAMLFIGSALVTQAGIVVNTDFAAANVSVARAIDVNTVNEFSYTWSDVNPLFNGNSTNGTVIYGGVSVTSASLNATNSSWVTRINSGSANAGLNKTASGNLNAKSLMLWDSADFLTGDDEFGSTGSSLSLTYGQLYDYSNGGLRFVIRDSAGLWISSANDLNTAGSGANFTLLGDAGGLQWGSFTATDYVNFENDLADVGMSVTFENRTFTGITGVGYIMDYTRGGANNMTFKASDFQVALVPEPASIGMIAVAGIGLIALRRIFSV